MTSRSDSFEIKQGKPEDGYDMHLTSELILAFLPEFEQKLEYAKYLSFDKKRQYRMIKMLLSVLLLSLESKEGQVLYIKVLEYAKSIDKELANTFWDKFDKMEKPINDMYITFND